MKSISAPPTRNALRLALLASVLGAAVPGASLAETVLTVAQRSDPQNLDPIDTFKISWGAIGSNVFEGLVFRGEDLELQPGLATSWEFLDEDRRIRFHLREGVEFQDGEPFDAAAVKYTFDRLLGEQGEKGPQRSNYTSIKEVVVVDDRTVDFLMNRPDPVLLTKLAGYGAMIVPPDYIEKVGEEAFDMKPIGTGPFRVEEYTPGVGVKLVKSDSYWNGAAKVDAVNIRFIPEDATRMAELQSGGVDIALDIPKPSVDTIRKSRNLELVSVDGPTVSLTRFNTQSGITADPRVRRAIAHAIDTNAIIQSLLGGMASPIASAQGAKSFGNDPDLAPYAYDPELAKTLLAEAGVAPGTEISLDYPSNDNTFREVSQVMAAYLGMVGLNLSVHPYEYNVYYNDILPNGKTGALYYYAWGGWTFDFDNTAYLLYHSGERQNAYISDPTLDALLEQQRDTYDQQVRLTALQGVADYVYEHTLDLPLYNEATLYAVNKRVGGFVPAPDNRLRYMNVTVQ
ncbi:ABC transporter substrate-binding protein [Falsirhodobacter algicola]|uniref:ABC transporter substrate-binding protein n=1 Tax=Falsirhodobacter algicola TaxID=2692330 RepID=A0A8J8MST9_9RHOB|nr:ABC transporter substrate-binding protein [Falsirhodobacter algicola]QUS35663.1 ABC transporter substrate-binding protein [Falsirhodobacter algicola]